MSCGCTSFRLWQTCRHMFKVTHRHDFVSQKVCRHPSFSVWIRTRTRLVVDTLRGYMVVEIKRKKLCHKLHTDTSWCGTLFRLHLWEIMWQTRCHMFKLAHRHDFVSQKLCRHPSFSVWIRTRTRLVVDTLRGYMVIKIKRKKLCHVLHTDTSFYVTICTWRRLVSKKVALWERFVSKKVVMWYFVSTAPVGNYVTNKVSYV